MTTLHSAHTYVLMRVSVGSWAFYLPLFFCFCRKGSVIITFSVNFDAVDSEQVVELTDSMENEGLLSALGSVTLVNITADKGNVSSL